MAVSQTNQALDFTLPVFTFLLNVSLTACFNVSVLKEAS